MSWLALFVMAAFSRAVAYVCGLPPVSSTAVLTLAIAIAGPTWLGRITSDFTQATLLTGLACLAGLAVLWRIGPPASFASKDSAGPTPWVLRIPIALATTLVIWAALAGHFWDEHSCHYTTASVIARGVFPPEHPLFPGEPFRYHFGYNVLAAHARVLTNLPIDVALDIATIVSFLFLLVACRAIGRQLGGRWGGGLCMLLAPLGGGTLAFLLFNEMGVLEVHWDALPRAWRNSTPPPVISNFFQHPQGLGMGFAAASIGLFASTYEDDTTLQRRRLAVAAFVLGVGALVHVVFFAVLGVALGISAMIRAVHERSVSRWLLTWSALIVALGLGYSLGGFFAPGPRLETVLRWGTSFFRGSALSVLAQHAVLFGLPWLLLPIALLRVIRRRDDRALILVIAAFVGFIVPNIVTYARSWDIVKFLGVGMFFANVLFAALLAAAVQRSRRWAVPAAFAVVLATNTAWLWLARSSMFDGRLGIPKMHFPGSSRAHHEWTQHFAPLIPARDRVFVVDTAFAQAGGFLTPGFDWRRVGRGFMLDRAEAHRAHKFKQRARRTLDPAAMKGLGVRWAILTPADRRSLTSVGKQRLQQRDWYEKVAEYGPPKAAVRLYRLLPPALGVGGDGGGDNTRR